MLKVGIKYALVCGIFQCLVFYISYVIGYLPFTEISHLFVDIFIFGLFIYFGINEFRKYENDEELHFWQGMTIGFYTYSMSVIVFLIFISLWFQFDDSLLSRYHIEAMSTLEKSKEMYVRQFGEEQYINQLNSIGDITGWQLSFSTTIKKLLIGLFVTPVISLFLRKKKL